MAIRPESRWWIVTLVLVALLFGLSALALDRPDVVWSAGLPHCPHCRHEVHAGARRCTQCREEFDWSVAPVEDSPLSTFSLSPLEEEHLRARAKALTEPVAVERIAGALGISTPDAQDYLRSVGSGQCGFCGGTGRDLTRQAATQTPTVERPAKPTPCPVCQGGRRCIACGGDRRVRLGDLSASQALDRYLAQTSSQGRHALPEAQRSEFTRLNQEFLERHAGTLEAQRLWFPPDWPPASPGTEATQAAATARARLDLILQRLQSP